MHTRTLRVSLCILMLLPPAMPDEPGLDLPKLYPWATEEWRVEATHILAGETVQNCPECDRWVACTMVRDVIRGRCHPNNLHPGRWHGWSDHPRPHHREAVEQALRPFGLGCRDVPVCRYLGNLDDYEHWLETGLASEIPSHTIGTSLGAIVCVP